MNRLALISAALLVLAACGAASDTCTSNEATPQNTNPGGSCTVAAGQPVTINVQLCAKCSDSAPGCQAEFVNGGVEVAPTVQQCQADLGCAVNGCNLGVPTASCSLTIPAGTTGQIPLHIVASPVVEATINIGSGTSCTL
jgi:hypothetical protein